MRLGPAPKLWTEDGHRTVDPATTFKRIEPLCKTAGITRVADITGLDRVGIPVFSASDPMLNLGRSPFTMAKVHRSSKLKSQP